MHLCYYHSEDLWNSCYAEREDPELVMVLSYLEIDILNVESCEPGPLGEGWDKINASIAKGVQ